VSEPAEEIIPPPLLPPPPAEEPVAAARAAPRRFAIPALIAAAAIIAIVAGVATTPFWALQVIHALPWGTPQASQPPVAAPARSLPQPAPAGEPAIAAVKAEADQSAATLQQLTQRIALLETRPATAAPDLRPVEQQLGALAKTTADLSQHVDALDKAVQQQPAADPKAMAMALMLLQIREAVDTGRPFGAEYQALAALAHDHPEIAAAAAPLAEPAESGVASRAVLAERLRQLAPQIATAKPPPKATWKSQIVARLRALVTIRRIDEGEGQTRAEAAVATAQHDVAAGDLTGAVAALSTLSGPNAAAAEPWLKMATARLTVEGTLRQTEAALTAALGVAMPAGKG
jgi:hypothetical protein